jgi:hypothetical protein
MICFFSQKCSIQLLVCLFFYLDFIYFLIQAFVCLFVCLFVLFYFIYIYLLYISHYFLYSSFLFFFIDSIVGDYLWNSWFVAKSLGSVCASLSIAEGTSQDQRQQQDIVAWSQDLCWITQFQGLSHFSGHLPRFIFLFLFLFYFIFGINILNWSFWFIFAVTC